MKELSIIEMNDVSGAYSWSWGSFSNVVTSAVSNLAEAAAAITLGSVTGGLTGSIIGGANGGNGGGILGFGTIGQGVGMIYSGIIGAIGGGIAGGLVGWDMTLDKSLDILDGAISGDLKMW